MSPTAPESPNFPWGEGYASLPPHLRRYTPAPGGCWIAERRSPNGYAANTSYLGRKGSVYKLIYEIVMGPIPKGLVLDHLCDNGPGGCCNPEHLRVCTQRENVRRSKIAPTAINARKTHCPRGHEYTPENTIQQSQAAGGGRDCRTCKEIRQQEFLERHPKEELARRRRDYYARNAERLRAQKLAYRQRTREQRRSRDRARYAEKKAQREQEAS